MLNLIGEMTASKRTPPTKTPMELPSLAIRSHTLVKPWLRMAKSEVKMRMLVSTAEAERRFSKVCITIERDCCLMQGDAEKLTVGPSAGETYIDQSATSFATLQG